MAGGVSRVLGGLPFPHTPAPMGSVLDPPPTPAFLVTNPLHEHTFPTASVEFAVKDLLPRVEVEFAPGDGDDNLASHDLAFEIRIGVVFAGAIVMIERRRF